MQTIQTVACVRITWRACANSEGQGGAESVPTGYCCSCWYGIEFCIVPPGCPVLQPAGAAAQEGLEVCWLNTHRWDLATGGRRQCPWDGSGK